MPTEFGLGDTYFTIYDRSGNIVYEGKADDLMNSKTVKPKPPLGAMLKIYMNLKESKNYAGSYMNAAFMKK